MLFYSSTQHLRFHPLREAPLSPAFIRSLAVCWPLNKHEIGLTLSANYAPLLLLYYRLIHEHQARRNLLLVSGGRLLPARHGKSCEFMHPIHTFVHMCTCHIWATRVHIFHELLFNNSKKIYTFFKIKLQCSFIYFGYFPIFIIIEKWMLQELIKYKLIDFSIVSVKSWKNKNIYFWKNCGLFYKNMFWLIID